MGGLHGQSNLAVKSVKGKANIDQVADAVRRLINQDTYRFFITHAISSCYRILKVKLRGVLFTYGGGNATLGIFGITVVNAAFSYNERTAVLVGLQGGIQPVNTSTYYYKVIPVNRIILAGPD